METPARERIFIDCMAELDAVKREEAKIKERKKDLFAALKDAEFNPKRVRLFRRRVADPAEAMADDEAIDEMQGIWDRRSTIKRSGTPIATRAARDARMKDGKPRLDA